MALLKGNGLLARIGFMDNTHEQANLPRLIETNKAFDLKHHLKVKESSVSGWKDTDFRKKRPSGNIGQHRFPGLQIANNNAISVKALVPCRARVCI